MVDYDKFKKVLNDLIQLNLENRNNISNDHFSSMSLTEFAYEYCNVRCDIGRQTGKTRFIVENATKDDLIVCWKGIQREKLKEQTSANVIVWEELKTIRIKNKKVFSKIYVDEYNFTLGRNTIFDLYKNTLFNKDQTFILLGI